MARSASVKDFYVDMDLKNNGIEIQVSDDGKQYGDLHVAKTGIVWCDGKVMRKNGTKFSYDELSLLSAYKAEALKAAKSAKKTAEA